MTERSLVERQSEALRFYLEYNGAIHAPGCPADDTCSCEYKWVNDGVNDAAASLAQWEARWQALERITREAQMTVASWNNDDRSRSDFERGMFHAAHHIWRKVQAEMQRLAGEP